MKNKNKYIFGIAWIVNFLLMLFVILLPKNEKLFSSLYFVFLGCIFFVPVVLLGCQLFLIFKNDKINKNDFYIHTIGASLLMSLTFVRFISSIKKEVIPQMVVIFLTFIMAETLVGFLLSKEEKFIKNKHFFGALLVYLLLVLFFFAAMIMSYDYSIIW